MSTAKGVLVISTSLNENSTSRRLADFVYKRIKAKSDVTTFCDMRAYPLPLCNGHDQSAYTDPHVKTVHDIIAHADSIILATPIYNYTASAALKNLVELTSHAYKDVLTGDVWNNKLLGFLLGMGSSTSYMSITPVMNSFFLDFQSLICPRFVCAQSSDFEGEVPNTKITDRLERFVESFLGLHEKLRS